MIQNWIPMNSDWKFGPIPNQMKKSDSNLPAMSIKVRFWLKSGYFYSQTRLNYWCVLSVFLLDQLNSERNLNYFQSVLIEYGFVLSDFVTATMGFESLDGKQICFSIFSFKYFAKSSLCHRSFTFGTESTLIKRHIYKEPSAHLTLCNGPSIGQKMAYFEWRSWLI